MQIIVYHITPRDGGLTRRIEIFHVCQAGKAAGYCWRFHDEGKEPGKLQVGFLTPTEALQHAMDFVSAEIKADAALRALSKWWAA